MVLGIDSDQLIQTYQKGYGTIPDKEEARQFLDNHFQFIVSVEAGMRYLLLFSLVMGYRGVVDAKDGKLKTIREKSDLRLLSLDNVLSGKRSDGSFFNPDLRPFVKQNMDRWTAELGNTMTNPVVVERFNGHVSDSEYNQVISVSEFEKQLLKYRERLFVRIYSIMRTTRSRQPYEDSEDLLQETFLKAWRGYHGLRTSYISTWLYAIATNVTRSFLRGISAYNTRLENYARGMEDVFIPRVEQHRIKTEEDGIIISLIGTLEDNYREAMWLRYVEGHSYEETVALLSRNSGEAVSISALKTRLFRGRQQLKNAILFGGDIPLDIREDLEKILDEKGRPYFSK